MNRKMVLFVAAVVLLAGWSVAPAQRVDPYYTASAEKDTLLESTGNALVSLADGKILALTVINTNSRVLIRLNADGSTDPSFNCTACNFEMLSIAAQPDGKYLVGGFSGNFSRFIRINSDGSIDPSFSNPFSNISGAIAATVYTVTPAGQIYATWTGGGNKTLRRLNSDGGFDNSFAPLPMRTDANIIKIMPLPDGKLLMAGNFLPHGVLFRLNADGTNDASWTSPVLSAPTSPPPFATVFLTGAELQADGKAVITGQFNMVNGISRRCIARLNADSTLDTATATGLTWSESAYSRVMRQSDGKLVLYIDNQGSGSGFRRLNSDLTVDNSFITLPASLISFGMTMVLNSNDQATYIQAGFIKRLNTDGTQDNNAAFSIRSASSVSVIAIQPDGKTVVAGSFKYLNGVAQPTVGRFNPDGTRDGSFVTGTGFSSAPSKMAALPNGKILVLGNFSSYNGVSCAGLIRLGNDGSLDATFAPSVAGANTFDVQPDGKILLLGGNITVNGSPRTGAARLNSDGTLDAAFSPVVGAPNVTAGFVQMDGKIMIAGSFSSVNSVARANIARLNSDGSLDTSFDAGNISTISAAAVYLDGKYAVAFNSQLFRLNANGTQDPAFTPYFPTTDVTAILPEAGGSTIVGTANPGLGRVNLFRVKPSGVLDLNFLPLGANAPVRALARRPDKKIIVGGDFSRVGGILRASIARIVVPGTPFDFDGDGRTDPSVTRPSDFVWHQLSTAGGYTYTATPFGQPGDKVVPGDYDGDGRTDIAIWRPSTGDWSIRFSSSGNIVTKHFGDTGDTPLPADYDGDGRTDLVVVTPGYAWKGIKLANDEVIVWHQFGQAGDKPVIGDFDGDGQSDLAYFRSSTGRWYYNKSSSGANLQTGVIHWGIAEDVPVSGDYDGDGSTDAAVFRPSEGNWYVLNSNGGYTMLHFGATGDKPIAADYDGDGKIDIAVYRPSEGFWYELLSTGGYTGYPWGNSTDIPTPNALIPQ